MKNNKLIKIGMAWVSIATLVTVAPALTNNPILGSIVVKAEEQQGSLNYRISYYDGETGEEIAAKKTGVINPGETVNVHKDIDGYEVTSKDSWMPNYEATYDIVAKYFHGDPDGYKGFYLDYKKLNPAPTPDPVPTPDPAKPGKDQKDPAKPGQDQKDPGKDQKEPGKDKQLPNTGEQESGFTLLGMVTAILAWLTLRKKKNY